MDFLTVTTPPPTSLPVTAMWVAAGLQRLIAGEELKHVAEQIGADKTDGAQEDAASMFLSTYNNAIGNAAGAATNGFYTVVPEAKAAKVLNACQIPSGEDRQRDRQPPIQPRDRPPAQWLPWRRMWSTWARPSPSQFAHARHRPAPDLARLPLTSAACPACADLTRPFAGLALIALGVLASTSTINLLNAAGLLAVLVGLLLVAVGAARRILLALAIVTVTAGAALAAAAYIPMLRDHLFPWLEKTVIPSLARHPAEWAILVIFVLLPPIWTIVVIIQRVTQRRKTSKTAAAAPAPAGPAAAGPEASAADGPVRKASAST